jgi:putative ABC transport system ATP-binding protein
MSPPAAPTLLARDLHRGFTSGHVRQEVIHGASLQAFAGELTMIVGPSGSGKTTLLGLLSGLLAPDAGEIRCLDTQLEQLDEAARERYRLRNSGFVFQGFNLFSALTAFEQIVLPLRYVKDFQQDYAAAAHAALAQVGLAGKEHLRPLEMSGGEKQRVAIARAIAKAPRLLFADEPTSALDSVNAERVIDLFRDLAHRQKSTILCVTHDERLLRYADRVLHLRDGIILETSQPTAP